MADGFMYREAPASATRAASAGKHLQHWPNHDTHIHVHVRETDYALKMQDAPFEAP